MRLIAVTEAGVLIRGRRQRETTIPLEDILTAEVMQARCGFHLHVRSSRAPLRVGCRRAERRELEDALRFEGVRIVDCWGAIIAPTLLDFEEELARAPRTMRQSSDSG